MLRIRKSMDEENPFASPQVASGLTGQRTDDHSEDWHVRMAHLGHEKTIKSMGSLYYMAAGVFSVMCLGTVGALMFVALQVNRSNGLTFVFLSLGLYAFLAASLFWMGWGLRRLKAGVRMPAIILSVIGLIGFPVGTIINGYFLYVLCSQKGVMVFTPEYHRVIQQTSQIKYKTSAVAWIVLFFLVLLAIVATMFSSVSFV